MATEESISDFLSHHGVKGMHWGIHREITPEKQAVRDKKAKFYTKKSDYYKKQIDKLDQKTPRNSYHANTIAEARATLVKKKALADKDAQRKASGKLSSSQRKALLIGGAAAALFVASHMTTKTSVIPKTHSHAGSVENLINAERDTQMYSLKRMHQEGKMNKEQFKNFSKKLNDRYDKKLVDALAEARNAGR